MACHTPVTSMLVTSATPIVHCIDMTSYIHRTKMKNMASLSPYMEITRI